ncbi:MAG TPA: hypothetical protein VI916_05750 [Acidimicrobiia bacterium]|nr:hypothetical protein [Acidimicrobiia bacterium]
MIGLAFFFLLVCAPTTYRAPKAAFLVVVLALLALRLWRTKTLGVHPAVLGRALLFSAVGLAFVLLGSIRGNPGALPMMPVFAFWPLVYTLLLGGLDERRRLMAILAALVAALLAIEVYAYLYLLDAAGALPVPLYVPLDLGQGVSENFREFTINPLASIVFLLPFAIGALLIWPRGAHGPIRRGWLWLAVALSGPLVILSGRKGFWLALAVSSVVALILRRWLVGGGWEPMRWRRSLTTVLPITAFALLIAQWTVGLTAPELWNYFVGGFDFSTGDAGLGRSLQFEALWSGWSNSPLIGQGLGAVAPDVIRSSEQPWAYELSYVALLFTTGVVGVTAYAYGIAWIFRQAGTMIREHSEWSPTLLALLVGMTGMLVANFTNPYLAKFDLLWTIFLPIGVINHWLLHRDEPVAHAPVPNVPDAPSHVSRPVSR